ncbi:MAG: type II toxin-antitoxin system VapC family toxin [Alphaproteobacteria bacterium]|nr:type II toxin-antitoxin system VapC family toxin [Alphaproteobacteria bacterium]
MIVVDASFLLHAFLDSAVDPSYLNILETKGDLIAPHHIDLEFINAVRRQLRLKLITEGRANQAISDFNILVIERFATTHLSVVIWSMRDKFTPYDAAYVALAESLAIPLLTRDQKLIAAIKAHTTIDLI